MVKSALERVKAYQKRKLQEPFFCKDCGEKTDRKSLTRKYCPPCRTKNRILTLSKKLMPRQCVVCQIIYAPKDVSQKFCPNCFSRRNSYWYENNKEYDANRKKEYSKNNKDKLSKLRFIRRHKEKDILHWGKVPSGNICCACGKEASLGKFCSRRRTIDHRPPVFSVPKGFLYSEENLEVVCAGCNTKRRNRFIRRAGRDKPKHSFFEAVSYLLK